MAKAFFVSISLPFFLTLVNCSDCSPGTENEEIRIGLRAGWKKEEAQKERKEKEKKERERDTAVKRCYIFVIGKSVLRLPLAALSSIKKSVRSSQGGVT